MPLPKKPPLIMASDALSDWKLWVPETGLKKDSILSLIYSNLGIKKIKYNNKESIIPKNIKKNY